MENFDRKTDFVPNDTVDANVYMRKCQTCPANVQKAVEIINPDDNHSEIRYMIHCRVVDLIEKNLIDTLILTMRAVQRHFLNYNYTPGSCKHFRNGRSVYQKEGKSLY